MKHSSFRSLTAGLWILSMCGARASDIHVAPPPIGAVGNPGTPESPLSLIQLAVFKAADGDTVWVAPGTYNESVTIQGRDITLRSHDPTDPAVVAQTVIDGTGMTLPAIRFDGSESPACMVSGFTIRNFRASAHGGAIRGGTESEHTRASVSHNVIENNHATRYGGGICYCDGDIIANTIRGNDSYDGGGLAFCDGTICNNTVEDNTAGIAGEAMAWCAGTLVNNIAWHYTGAPGSQLHECSTPSHCCVGGWSGGGAGNTATAPGFVDPNGPDNLPQTVEDNDYRLLAGSPCIDGGLNDPLAPPHCDLDGHLRIARVSAPSPVVDIGAYEFASRPLRIAEFGFTDFPSPRRYFGLDSQPGDRYVLWSTYGLNPPHWTQVRTVTSGGASTYFTDTTLVPIGIRKRFYKVTME